MSGVLKYRIASVRSIFSSSLPLRGSHVHVHNAVNLQLCRRHLPLFLSFETTHCNLKCYRPYIAFILSSPLTIPRIDCQLGQVILQHKSPSTFMLCTESGSISFSTCLGPTIKQTLIRGRVFPYFQGNLSRAGARCMDYDRHPRATRGVIMTLPCYRRRPVW
jgi:hypothetical protein